MEKRILVVRRILQIPAQRCVHNGPRDVDVHACADAKGAAAPARVDQVDLRIVPLHALAQHRGIDVRVAGHERLAKKAGECADRVHDTGFGAGQFAGVAHQKPEHGLLWVQFGHRGQDSVGVGRQEQDRLRMVTHGRGLDVAQEAQRV